MTELEIKQAAASYAWKALNTNTDITIEQNFIAGAEANAPKVIPVTESKPAHLEFVLAYGQREWEKEARWHTTRFYAEDKYNKEGFIGFVYVTHWMPIPSPPNTQP